jgi:chemotaxis protein MotA
MDSISLVGITLGFAAILVGQVLEGGHIGSLVQPTAFLIVIGGTLGAVMLQSSMKVFRTGMQMFRWVFAPPDLDHDALIAEVVSWSNVARKEGLLALESQGGDKFQREMFFRGHLLSPLMKRGCSTRTSETDVSNGEAR